jgi:hypothetical protein
MDDIERSRMQDEIDDLKASHKVEINSLNEVIDGQNERIKELENVIAEIYETARRA